MNPIEKDGSLTPLVTGLAIPTALIAGRDGAFHVSNCGYHCDDQTTGATLGVGLLRSATGATLYIMKSRVITQRELRNESGAILREVEAGRTVIVSRNGTPVGELRPIRRRRFVPRAAIADAAARAVRVDAGQFRADLDAVVDPHAHG